MTLGSALDELLKTKTLSMKPQSWRAFLGHAERDGLNKRVLEIRCMQQRPLLNFFGKDVHVGPQQERLDTLPVSLTLVQVEQGYFKEGDAPAGKLTYHAPIHTADGVVNDKTGSITGWLVVGKENYDDAWRRLSTAPFPEFVLGLTVRFQDRDHTWDGSAPLEIEDGSIVFSGTPPKPEPRRDEEVQEERPTALITKLDELGAELRAIAKRMDYAGWLAVVVIILFGLWLRH